MDGLTAIYNEQEYMYVHYVLSIHCVICHAFLCLLQTFSLGKFLNLFLLGIMGIILY